MEKPFYACLFFLSKEHYRNFAMFCFLKGQKAPHWKLNFDVFLNGKHFKLSLLSQSQTQSYIAWVNRNLYLEPEVNQISDAI